MFPHSVFSVTLWFILFETTSMRIVMMGTGTFAEPTFAALLAGGGRNVVGLVTQPDRDGGQKRGSTRQTGVGMKTLAERAGVPVAQPESINTPDGLEQLRAMKPDLLVVAAYGQILSRDVLATPAVGTINVHASLLPKYRGAAPVAYAIWKGETRTGVSIIKVTPGLDSGDILLQGALDIGDDETAGELETRLAAHGADLAATVVDRIAAEGWFAGTPQDPALVTKAPKLKKEDGLIDWSKPAWDIVCHIRAMQPWPTPYTFLHRPGKEPMRVIINLAHMSFDPPLLGPVPGTLFHLSCEPDNFHVTAGGQETVVVYELQPAGKKRMNAMEFLRGHPLVEGMGFGPEVLS